MTDKFLALELPMQIFWGIALVTSVFFVIQTIMAFMGLDADTDDGSGFESVEMEGLSGYFSFRNLINFLLGYGWGGVLLQGAIPNMMWLEVAAVGVGLVSVDATGKLVLVLGSSATVINWCLCRVVGFPGGARGENLPASAGDVRDVGSVPDQDDPLEEGMATRSSICLENPMHRGAWWAAVHRVS